MKIYHLNCASFCPANILKSSAYVEKLPAIKFPKIGKKLLSKVPFQINQLEKKVNIDLNIEKSVFTTLQTMSTHCMLIETNNKLILVDTGIGHHFIKNNQKKLTGQKVTELFLGAKLDIKETAKFQVRELGFSPKDVTDIIISHFDFDHVSGLKDFPQATAHTFKSEYLFSSSENQTSTQKTRFLKELWNDHQHWNLLNLPKKKFQNLSVTEFPGSEEILLALLPGHTLYQMGVIIPKLNILFAADSYLHHSQLEHYPYTALPIKMYQKLTTLDEESYQKTLQKLMKFRDRGFNVFCAHDLTEFNRFNK